LASGAADLWVDDPTACDASVQKAGSRGPTHPSEQWQEFIPFALAHTPLKMSIDEGHNQVRIGWASSYSLEAIEKAVDSLNHKPLGYRVNILIARLCFRGIYFPQMGRFAWLKTILENRRTIFKLIRQGFGGGTARCGAVSRDPAGHRAAGLKLAFFNERLLFAKSCFSPSTSFPLQEHQLRTKLMICNETDYLQAHLTVIEGKPCDRNLTLHNLEQILLA
jgi:hypothetical protein